MRGHDGRVHERGDAPRGWAALYYTRVEITDTQAPAVSGPAPRPDPWARARDADPDRGGVGRVRDPRDAARGRRLHAVLPRAPCDFAYVAPCANEPGARSSSTPEGSPTARTPWARWPRTRPATWRPARSRSRSTTARRRAAEAPGLPSRVTHPRFLLAQPGGQSRPSWRALVDLPREQALPLRQRQPAQRLSGVSAKTVGFDSRWAEASGGRDWARGRGRQRQRGQRRRSVGFK